MGSSWLPTCSPLQKVRIIKNLNTKQDFKSLFYTTSSGWFMHKVYRRQQYFLPLDDRCFNLAVQKAVFPKFRYRTKISNVFFNKRSVDLRLRSDVGQIRRSCLNQPFQIIVFVMKIYFENEIFWKIPLPLYNFEVFGWDLKSQSGEYCRFHIFLFQNG